MVLVCRKISIDPIQYRKNVAALNRALLRTNLEIHEPCRWAVVKKSLCGLEVLLVPLPDVIRSEKAKGTTYKEVPSRDSGKMGYEEIT
jgi:hypothetical protein